MNDEERDTFISLNFKVPYLTSPRNNNVSVTMRPLGLYRLQLQLAEEEHDERE